MKCISLWQPWASLIVIGAKQYETRSWATSYRGLLLIHAAKKWNQDMMRGALSEPFCRQLGDYAKNWRTISIIPRGCIVGRVEVVECYQVFGRAMSGDGQVAIQFRDGRGRARYIAINSTENAFGDFSVGRYAWKLANPIRFAQPIPFPGRQQLFDVPAALVAGQLKGKE